MSAIRIPIVETYRGIGLHDMQDDVRLAIVRAEVDAVFLLAGQIAALADWAANRSRSPESRLLAAALINAEYELAIEQRRARPDVDLAWLAAVTTGLDSAKWRSRTHFDSALAPRQPPDCQRDPRAPVRRTVPLAG